MRNQEDNQAPNPTKYFQGEGEREKYIWGESVYILEVRQGDKE